MPYLIFCILVSLTTVLFSCATQAADSSTALSDIRLPTTTVFGDASFDTLSDESYAPVKQIKFKQVRSGTLESINQYEILPSTNLGYPSGASGISLGGRTIDDTQVFTLGVPLNLPQGGGADFSFFPSYLWSEALISPTISLAGFAPQASSGSIQLKPWTREILKNLKSGSTVESNARATVSYDRQLQTYSLATSKDRVALLAGMSTGLQTGPTTSLSYFLVRDSSHQVLAHFIGTAQEGDSPGSKSSPTPNLKKKVWRVIPVIESHQKLNPSWTLENTAYADLQSLRTTSESRTQQYGLENALLYRNYTLALSIRYISYKSSTQENHEWPLLGTLTGEYSLDANRTLRVTAGGNELNTAGGFYPLARVTAKNQIDSEQFTFAELGTTPKLPTLVDRFYPPDYYLGTLTYQGNPNLKPERIYSALAGHQVGKSRLKNTLTLKTEFRTNLQVSQNKTTENAGDAYLFSIKDDVFVAVTPWLELNASIFATYSRVNRAKEPYPNLPYYSQLLGAKIYQGDRANLNIVGRYVGLSRTPNFITATPAYIDHEGYFLCDAWVSYQATRELNLILGLNNIFDTRAEVVVDYPLPGRIVYLSAQANF